MGTISTDERQSFAEEGIGSAEDLVRAGTAREGVLVHDRSTGGDASVLPRSHGSLRSHVHAPNPPLLVWGLFALVAVEILVTYSRLPAKTLWRVSDSGLLAGTGRVLVFLGYPTVLAAIAVLLLLLDRLQTRLQRALALLAAGFCVVALVFVRTSSFDVRPVNAFGVVGVTIAVLLTLAAGSSLGRGADGRRDRGGRLRLGLAVALLLVAVPVMAADLGFYLDRVPLLGSVYETGALRHEPGGEGLHVAVHHGHHEGMDGVLLAWSALLLWRCIPTVANRRLRGLLGAYLAVVLCYGVAVAFGDFWLEQIVKRGWTTFTFDVLFPAFTPAWGILLGAAAALWSVSVWPSMRAESPERAGALPV